MHLNLLHHLVSTWNIKGKSHCRLCLGWLPSLQDDAMTVCCPPRLGVLPTAPRLPQLCHHFMPRRLTGTVSLTFPMSQVRVSFFALNQLSRLSTGNTALSSLTGQVFQNLGVCQSWTSTSPMSLTLLSHRETTAQWRGPGHSVLSHVAHVLAWSHQPVLCAAGIRRWLIFQRHTP